MFGEKLKINPLAAFGSWQGLGPCEGPHREKASSLG